MTTGRANTEERRPWAIDHLFATIYFLMAHAQPATFGVPLGRTDAMYFSATVFTTVGFGDIAARSQAARIIVTFEMMLDLVIIGIVV